MCQTITLGPGKIGMAQAHRSVSGISVMIGKQEIHGFVRTGTQEFQRELFDMHRQDGGEHMVEESEGKRCQRGMSCLEPWNEGGVDEAIAPCQARVAGWA